MKRVIINALLGMGCVAIAGAAIGFSAFANKSASLQPTAETVEGYRRVYVINDTTREGGGWSMWAKNGALALFDSTAAQWHDMTLLFSDYYDGVYYCDIPFTSTTVVISPYKEFKAENDKWQTDDMILPSFGTADVIKVAQKKNDEKYHPTFTTAPCGLTQMAWLLGNVATCTGGTASGWEAYPQLNANFFSVSDESVVTSTELVRKDAGYETADITIKDKIGYLQSYYDFNN